MEETLDTVDDEEIEEEADAEVDKVLFELTDGKLGQAGKVGGELPVSFVGLASHSQLTLGGQGGRGGRGGEAEDGAGDARPAQQLGWSGNNAIPFSAPRSRFYRSQRRRREARVAQLYTIVCRCSMAMSCYVLL